MIIAIIIQICERDFCKNHLPSQTKVVYQSDEKPKPAAYQLRRQKKGKGAAVADRKPHLC